MLIKSTNLLSLLEKEKGEETYIYLTKDFKGNTDFTKFITPNMPELIPLGAKINAELEVKQAISDIKNNHYAIRNVGQKTTALIISVIKKVDEVFFIEKDGQMYVIKETLTKACSYEEALAKLIHEVKSEVLRNRIYSVFKLVETRNNQIMNALIATNAKTDVTTQRTAEEIKMLVENLERDNPLRKAIEGTLEQNGYIAPIEDNPIR